jgi:hypothetical protein
MTYKSLGTVIRGIVSEELLSEDNHYYVTHNDADSTKGKTLAGHSKPFNSMHDAMKHIESKKTLAGRIHVADSQTGRIHKIQNYDSWGQKGYPYSPHTGNAKHVDELHGVEKPDVSSEKKGATISPEHKKHLDTLIKHLSKATHPVHLHHQSTQISHFLGESRLYPKGKFEAKTHKNEHGHEIHSFVRNSSLKEEFIEETHGAEEVKILSNPEAEQTPADIVAAKYVRKGKCGCNKAEVQKKIIDNA